MFSWFAGMMAREIRGLRDRLAVKVPVTHAHTIVQRVMRLSVSGAVGNTARESVGVLYVGLHTVGIQLVTGFHGINHIEVLSGVGERCIRQNRASRIRWNSLRYVPFSG